MLPAMPAFVDHALAARIDASQAAQLESFARVVAERGFAAAMACWMYGVLLPSGSGASWSLLTRRLPLSCRVWDVAVLAGVRNRWLKARLRWPSAGRWMLTNLAFSTGFRVIGFTRALEGLLDGASQTELAK